MLVNIFYYLSLNIPSFRAQQLLTTKTVEFGVKFVLLIQQCIVVYALLNYLVPVITILSMAAVIPSREHVVEVKNTATLNTKRSRM